MKLILKKLFGMRSLTGGSNPGTIVFRSCLLCEYGLLHKNKKLITCSMHEEFGNDIIDAKVNEPRVENGICQSFKPHPKKMKQLI